MFELGAHEKDALLVGIRLIIQGFPVGSVDRAKAQVLLLGAGNALLA